MLTLKIISGLLIYYLIIIWLLLPFMNVRDFLPACVEPKMVLSEDKIFISCLDLEQAH